MKVTFRALLSFMDDSDADLLKLIFDVIAALTGNAFFPAPMPKIDDMALLATAYKEALEACKNGNRVLIAAKNTQKQLVIDALREWTGYVNYKAAGNKEMLASSGLPITADPVTKPITKPEFKLMDGVNSGDLKARIKNRDAISYIAHFSTTNDGNPKDWKGVASSKATITISGLTSEKKYYVAIEAIGANKQSVFSDVLSRVVQ